jgi:hypothetical protein
MRPARAANRLIHHSWRFLVSAAAVTFIATMGFITWTVVDERTYFEQEQARDRRQDAQLARLLEHQEQRDVDAAQQIADALADAEQLLVDHFARHDLNVATKLNDLLAQIEALLARPAGTSPSPVTDRSPAPGSRPSAGWRLDTRPTAPPSPVTTTTTTPSQRRCAADPTHPRC